MYNIILILTGFQITWLACVFGEYYEKPIIGFIVGLFYLFIFFGVITDKIKSFKICLFFLNESYVKGAQDRP